MNLKHYERTDKNESFVMLIRLSTGRETIQKFDKLYTRLEAQHMPPDWLNLEYWLMTAINEIVQSKRKVYNLSEEIERRYKALAEHFAGYKPKVSSNEINLNSFR